jgi:hypothetical protein
MAPIIPAGKKTYDWAPTPEQVEKQAMGLMDDEVADIDLAEEEAPIEISDEDRQFDAIRDLPGIKDVADELDGAVELDEIDGPVEDVIESEPASDLEEAAEAAKDAIDTVVEQAEEAVAAAEGEEVAEDIAEEGGEISEEEDLGEETIEIEIEEVSDADSIPGIMDEDGGEKEGCMSDDLPVVETVAEKASDGDAEKWAANQGEFIRLADLSPQNRTDLVNYWQNMLGFPSEYVQAMVKKYE